ncbi:non-ribosomal peptide synthetase [Streptomyces bambusae]|uniref:non-ribosomal peptide synthetase n=1 Tax=Streptomyces bambusae TaxID=1550616 RepID=UPI001CFE627D|nr:non-ribosomal peptide synthetase [Streptomyces bambusae]MCB5165635.1 non-ribosomal peptide synthetase [Streptomyces bambusae]
MVSTSIHARFAEQTRRTPDAVAVSAGGTRLTYRELDERSDRVARRLAGLGVRPQDPVAVLVERSPELVVATLAILKAGAFYLPLHSAYPLERMQTITDRAGSPVLLTDRSPGTDPLPAGVRVLDPAAGDGPEAPADAAAGPDDIAYVIHTSGSTGEPKGVAVTHRGVVQFAADSSWNGGAQQTVLALAPYAFGVSTYELWIPLLRGGTVVLAPPGVPDVPTLRRLIAAEGITALHVTAGLFRVIAEEAPDTFAGVREVLTGGDVIAPTAVRRVLAACPDVVVRGMYGATEVSSFAAYTTMTAANPPAGAVPVGRPMDTVGVRLLDDALAEVEDGATGELFIHGDRLAQGYWQRPDLTAERFVDDPYGPPGARMYRTGDLMRRRSDGLLEFAGRAGDQFKINGYLVEPAEVEHALAQLPGIVHAAVVAREQADGTGRLTGYVVPAAGTSADPDALRAGLARTLPDYMVPAAFVELDELPLTPNGKLDRAALPEPAAAPAPAAGADSAPRTPRQETLCALFAEVLGLPSVGLDDSFIDLGGQSLQAVRLAGRIGARLGAEVTVGDIFNCPTVAELDTHLQEIGTAA